MSAKSWLIFSLVALQACVTNAGPVVDPETRAADQASLAALDAADLNAPATTRLRANDISVLFPLRNGADFSSLLRVQNGGLEARALANAEALEAGLLAAGINSAEAAMTTAAVTPRLVIVAVRFDPCMSMQPGASGAACVPQMRLVAQDVAVYSDRPAFEDRAFHLLYNLSDSAWNTVLSVLRRLVALSPSNTGELGVSPEIVASGYAGAYAQKLLTLIRAYAVPVRLGQVTVVEGSRPDNWNFGGAIVRAYPRGGFPSVGPLTTVMGNAILFQRFEGFGETPLFNGATPPFPDTFVTSLTRRRTTTARVYNPDTMMFEDQQVVTEEPMSNTEITDVYLRAKVLESPERNTPFTTDCISCHLASFTAREVERSAPQIAQVPANRPGRQDGVRSGDANLSSMRMFGYSPGVYDPTSNVSLTGRPCVMVRVALETDGLLRMLNASAP